MLRFLFGLVSVNKISSDNPRGYYFVVLVLVVIVVIDVTDVVLFEFPHMCTLSHGQSWWVRCKAIFMSNQLRLNCCFVI